MNTIQTKPPRKKTAKAGPPSPPAVRAPAHTPTIPAWWMAWVGLFLLAFGLPLMVARFMELPSEPLRLALLQGQKVSDEELDSLATARMRVAAVLRTSTLYSDLSLIAFEKSQRVQNPMAQKELRDAAEYWQRKALTVSPADPYGWFRLAHLLFAKEGVSPNVAEAWRQSMAAAPFEPRLILPRLQLALTLGNALDEASRRQIPRLIWQAWKENGTHLAKAAKEGSFISIVEDVFRDEAQTLKYFHDQLDLL